jgi:hypothetical protein
VLKFCESVLKQQDDKPRIDPFIVMEDIVEKLRLLDYENTFCKKYKKEIINKFYFASFTQKQPMNKNSESSFKNSQFAYFYELSNWLISLIKQVSYLIYISVFKECKFRSTYGIRNQI